MKTTDALLRKKGLGLSIILHISIVVFLTLIHYTTNKINIIDNLDQVNFIEIQFSNSSTSSGMGSTKNNLENIPIEKVTARDIEEKIIKTEPLEEAKSNILVKNINTKVSDIEIKENSNTEGDGDKGEMISGIALGALEFDGQGVFGRKVIYHAPIKEIAKVDGRVAINIAINRTGRVIGAAIYKNESTIIDHDLLIKSLEMILKYEFEPDYSAPKIQYGKFTFIFDLKIK